MGRTRADRHQIMYRKWKLEGYSDDEIMEFIPSGLKEKFKDDIQKTPFEAHFGMSAKNFIYVFILILIICLAIVSYGRL